ncbi:uncharacterized protein LOC112494028 isoform X2 [Cephus cinctus]|uniref:Uncharacterized protein LOC112494028 isoform X2 n=1 Tax=Cephus cinctus TaxID=211228 RepID=A0AAJ7VZ38_CEPCN|nr:uncharacterized protein LOC112494028 isoform X2 [Cephus cinctus]
MGRRRVINHIQLHLHLYSFQNQIKKSGKGNLHCCDNRRDPCHFWNCSSKAANQSARKNLLPFLYFLCNCGYNCLPDIFSFDIDRQEGGTTNQDGSRYCSIKINARRTHRLVAHSTKSRRKSLHALSHR